MSVQLDCGCPANLVKAGAPHNLNCPTNGPLADIDHAFQPYHSGKEALVDVCCECGDYHDERRTIGAPQEVAAGALLERIEAVGGSVTINDKLLSSRALKELREAKAGKVVVHHDYESIGAVGMTWDVLHGFRSAARRLKSAESEFHAAQQNYADWVKRLSDEAVK